MLQALRLAMPDYHWLWKRMSVLESRFGAVHRKVKASSEAIAVNYTHPVRVKSTGAVWSSSRRLVATPSEHSDGMAHLIMIAWRV